MKRLLTALLSAAAIVAPAGAFSQSPTPDLAAAHIERARVLAGTQDLPAQQHLCYYRSPQDTQQLAARRAASVLKPTRVFDNFYYVGAEDVSAWALVDPKGIILFDSLHSPQEAQAKIVGGLIALGLDPHAIKYVVITHGHGDHFGGAQYLADTYGAQLVASSIDWQVMHGSSPEVLFYKKYVPKTGLSVGEGDILTLGNLKVKFYVTPGHTPGTLSTVFTVMDNGTPRTVAFWGGIGLRDRRDEAVQYVASLDRFRAIAQAARADIGISNHPHADMTLERVANLSPYPRTANPLVTGPAGVDTWLNVVEECAKAQVAKLDAQKP
jgi:metallo-beta-lactamase class B